MVTRTSLLKGKAITNADLRADERDPKTWKRKSIPAAVVVTGIGGILFVHTVRRTALPSKTRSAAELAHLQGEPREAHDFEIALPFIVSVLELAG